MEFPVGHIIDARLKYGDLYYLNIDKISIFIKPMSLKKFDVITKFIAAYPGNVENIKEKVFLESLIQYIDMDAGMFYIKDMEDDPAIFTKDMLLDVIPAGIVDTVFSAILKLSGPSDVQQLEYDLNLSRNIELQDVIGTMLSLIASAYKADMEELREKNWTKILAMFSTAEMLLSGNMPELPLKLETDDK